MEPFCALWFCKAHKDLFLDIGVFRLSFTDKLFIRTLNKFKLTFWIQL